MSSGISLGTIASAVGIAGGVNSLMNSGGSQSSGNVAGGAGYDPFASGRGRAGQELQNLIYGTGGTTATPMGTSSSGQTYQQYLQSMSSGGLPKAPPGAVQDYSMGAFFSGGGGGGTPMSEAQWNQQNPGSAGTPGSSSMDLIKNMPGYQFQADAGMQSVNRSTAASGQSLSGNQLIALQNQGTSNASSFYNTMINNLMGMSGATQNPMNVTPQNSLNASQNQNAWQGIGQGLGSLQNTFNNSPTSISTPNAPAGYSGVDSGNTNSNMMNIPLQY